MIRHKIWIISLLIFISFCIGCIQPISYNGPYSDNSSNIQIIKMETTLSEPKPLSLYTDPIGGFQDISFLSVSPNSTYETTYVLYTRNRGGSTIQNSKLG